MAKFKVIKKEECWRFCKTALSSSLKIAPQTDCILINDVGLRPNPLLLRKEILKEQKIH